MNTMMICKCCSEKRKALTQEDIEEKLMTALKDGHFFIKVAFAEDASVEHMWVKVSAADFDAKKVGGILDNDPVLIQQCKAGDKVIFNFSDIEEIMR